MPHVPRLPNPTPEQVHVGLELSRRAIARAVGPNPTPQRLAAFQHELATDPRLNDFRVTLHHYIGAAERHLERQEGRRPGAFLGGVNRQAREGAEAAQAPWEQEEAQKRQEGSDLNPLGLVDLTKLATKLGSVKVPGVGGVPGKLINEAVDLPAQTFLSSAIAGSAARSAIEGNTAPGKQILDQVLQQVEHPIKSFESQPLSTALLFAGGENVLGRLVGKGGAIVKAARDAPAATASEAIKAGLSRANQRATLARPDLNLYGNEKLVGRSYNPDPLRKAAQLAYERKILPNLPRGLAQEDPFQATGWRLRRNLVGGKTKVGVLDRSMSAKEDTRRTQQRGNIGRMEEVRPHGQEHAVSLIVQRVIRRPDTVRADLLQRVGNLKSSLAETDAKGRQLRVGKDRKAILANLANAEALLHNKDFLHDPSAAFHAADVYEKLQKPLTRNRIYGGQLDAEQLRAALFPYATEHMGARHTIDTHPADVARYEASQAEIKQSKGAVKDAQKAVHDAEIHRARMGERSRVRSRSAPPRELEHRAGAGGGQVVQAADARLAGAKERLRAAKANHAEILERAEPAPHTYGALRGPHGEPLPSEAILEHMEANGVKPPGFVSHQAGIAGRRSHYSSTLKNPPLESWRRTGESFRTGTADSSWEALVGNLAKQTGKSAQLEIRRATAKRYAIGPQLASEAEAWHAADNFNNSRAGEAIKGGLGEVVPYHLGSGKIVERGHTSPQVPADEVLHQFGLEPHTPAVAAEHGRYALIPREVAARMQEHEDALQSSKTLGRDLQRYQQAFRSAKLNTSVPHMVGIAQEQGIRLLFEGAGPRARAAGAKWERNMAELAQIDKNGMLVSNHGPEGDLWREIHSTTANRGGLAGVSGTKYQDAVRKADQLGEGAGHVVRAGEALAGKPGGKQLVAAWDGWKHVVQGSLARLEHGTRNALLGQQLRETGLIDSYHQLLSMSDEAVKDMIRGTYTVQKADRLAKAIDDAGGNWNRQTPAVREAVGKYVPFGLWWLNSMRWLYRLPVTHPIKTAIVAALYSATKEQRNGKGQGWDAASPVPNFLQGTIDVNLPLLGKGKIAPSYYSPGGTLGPEALHTAADLIAPWAQGTLSVAKGENPLSGATLEKAGGGELTAPEAALNTAAEVFAGPIPFATQAQKLLTGGGKPVGTSNLITDLLSRVGGPSQVKPGTERSPAQVLGKLISPTRFDFPSASESGAGSGSLNPRTERALRRARHTGLSARTQAQLRRARARAGR